MAWQLAEPSPTFVSRFNDYDNRRSLRTQLMLKVTTYLKFLNQEIDPYDPNIEFTHVVKSGILAISDGAGHAANDWIYAFPHQPKCMLHLLVIGDRASLDQDVALCEVLTQTLRE